jgi:hypothetical protein
MTKTLLGCLVCAVLALAPGCASETRPKLTGGKVAGKVTLDGKAVTGGTITLYQNNGKRVLIPIGPEGDFISPNVPVGEVRVSIETESAKMPAEAPDEIAMPKNIDPEMAKFMEQFKKPAYVAIPKRYNDPGTSGLTITITQGKQARDFDLTQGKAVRKGV